MVVCLLPSRTAGAGSQEHILPGGNVNIIRENMRGGEFGFLTIQAFSEKRVAL